MNGHKRTRKIQNTGICLIAAFAICQTMLRANSPRNFFWTNIFAASKVKTTKKDGL